MPIERIDKFLANQGLASRKTIKRLLKEFNIAINGKRVKKSGERFDTQKDIITINDKKIEEKKFAYYILNKPQGVISTTSDEKGREDVTMYIDSPFKIYPVGRLDKDSHGLTLLTNDGELTHKLIHPKFHIPKVYEIIIQGKPLLSQLERFRKGVLLSDGLTLPTEVVIKKESEQETVLKVTLYEGRNRQIRRMCKVLSMELTDLKRISFGPLTLGKLPEGSYKELKEKEIKELKNMTIS